MHTHSQTNVWLFLDSKAHTLSDTFILCNVSFPLVIFSTLASLVLLPSLAFTVSIGLSLTISSDSYYPPQPESPLWNSTPCSTILPFLWWMAVPQVLSACPSSHSIKTIGMTNIFFFSPFHPSPFKHPLHAISLLSGHHHCSLLPPHLSQLHSLPPSNTLLPLQLPPRTLQSILWRKNIIYSVLPR